jgi:hypothetical protein
LVGSIAGIFQKGDDMRTKIKRFSAIIILAALFLGLLVGGTGSFSLLPYTSAAASNGPQLSIQSNIPANPNSTVVVPVQFTSNDNKIDSTVFSIDYDETWLAFDNSIPNALQFNLPPDFTGQCSPDITDTDGEIDCFILDPIPPLVAIPDSVILNVTLRTKNPSSAVSAKAGFSANSPPASFASQGLSVAGSTLDGSVLIGQGFPSVAYLPIIWNSLVSPPTPIPTVTVTPTGTVTVTPIPSETPVPTCDNIFVNSGFEDKTGWELPITNYTAGYSTDKPRNGIYSMRTGINPPNTNIFSYSSARQGATITGNANSATLSMWVYPISGETTQNLAAPELVIGQPVDTQSFSADFQYILVLDQNNNLIKSLDIGLSNSQTWTHKNFDLSYYIGWYPIKIHFGTYNNGYGGITSMYVDDVRLEVCK